MTDATSLAEICQIIWKQVFCRQYWRGRCFRPVLSCPFAHGLQELVEPTPEQAQKGINHPALADIIHDGELVQRYVLEKMQQLQSEESKSPESAVEDEEISQLIRRLRSIHYSEDDHTQGNHYILGSELHSDSDEVLYPVIRCGRSREEKRQHARWQDQIMIDYVRSVFAKHPNALLTKDFVERQCFKVRIRHIVTRLSPYNLVYERKTVLPPYKSSKTTLLFLMPRTQEEAKVLLRSRLKVRIHSLLRNDSNATIPFVKKLIVKEDYSNYLVTEAPLSSLARLFDTDQLSLLNIMSTDETLRREVYEELAAGPHKDRLPEDVKDFVLMAENEDEHAHAKKVILKNLLQVEKEGHFVLPLNEMKTRLSSNAIFHVEKVHDIREICLELGWISVFTPNGVVLAHIPELVAEEVNSFEEGDYRAPESGEEYRNITSSLHKACPCFVEDIHTIPLPIDSEIVDPDPEVKLDRITIVDSVATLRRAYHELKDSSWLGVDLEGHLSFDGTIDLVQVANDYHIFIFDIQETQDEPLKGMIRGVLKNLFENPNQVKVFHDCRRDSEALHYLLQICPRNILDTSPCMMLLNQFLNYYSSYVCIRHELKTEKQPQNNSRHHPMHSKFKFSQLQPKSPGLNDVLQFANASHGVNTLKEKIHREMKNKNSKIFHQRPFNAEFLEYSAKDVEDLAEVGRNLVVSLFEQADYIGIERDRIVRIYSQVFNLASRIAVAGGSSGDGNTAVDQEEIRES
eukprot:CAMPEP_0114988748 /NCGR_PEP_ID=MMETSP0216-20121206/9786_1 /TAXON_ID=223996 /ORGANISM="Protocruzia adherens, Strain Boccale" /LENGTH=742 /DNA_ID=CAMNT_0002351593 /DNA_START=66 /DNA_END=2294 /DNA_ORIENTATION=-